MNTKTITSAVLVMAGTSITGIAYTPENTKSQPCEEVIKKYITTHTAKYKYNPMLNYQDHMRSEQRKAEIVGKITNIRAQIREKMLTTVLCTMTTRTLNKEHRILSERAQELGIPKKLLNKEKVLSRKGIISLDLETIL